MEINSDGKLVITPVSIHTMYYCVILLGDAARLVWLRFVQSGTNPNRDWDLDHDLNAFWE